jgi:hypothetical protein
MSDSLSATVIVIVLESISSANPEVDELESEEPEPEVPRTAAATEPAKPPVLELEVVDEEPVSLELLVPLVDTD